MKVHKFSKQLSDHKMLGLSKPLYHIWRGSYLEALKHLRKGI